MDRASLCLGCRSASSAHLPHTSLTPHTHVSRLFPSTAPFSPCPPGCRRVREAFLAALQAVLRWRRCPFRIDAIDAEMSSANKRWSCASAARCTFTQLCQVSTFFIIIVIYG